jgi:hypothetical protein
MRLIEKIRHNFRYESKEALGLVSISVVLGFILSFRDWGDPLPVFKVGMLNWINSALVVFLSLVIVTSVQKLFAIKKNHNVNYKPWLVGLFVSFFVALFTEGNWLFLLPGGLLFSSLKLGHLGDEYEGRVVHHTRAIVAFMGPLTHLILAYIFNALFLSGFDNYLVDKLITLNLVLAITTILPIPQMESLVSKISGMKRTYNLFKKPTALHGFYIFFDSRTFYVFSLVLILALASLMYSFHSLYSFIVAGLLASMISIIYLFSKEL